MMMNVHVLWRETMLTYEDLMDPGCVDDDGGGECGPLCDGDLEHVLVGIEKLVGLVLDRVELVVKACVTFRTSDNIRINV